MQRAIGEEGTRGTRAILPRSSVVRTVASNLITQGSFGCLPWWDVTEADAVAGTGPKSHPVYPSHNREGVI